MDIHGYYEIDIGIKKDWFGIYFSVCLGALEIIGGCVLLYFTGGTFGFELIEEGYEDIKYGVECILGKKEFSWSDVKKRKLNFLIKTAVNTTLKFLTGGFSEISKSTKLTTSLKSIFKQVSKRVLKKAAIDVGASALTHFIGPQMIEKVINKFKIVLREGVIKYFGNKLKEMIPEEFRSIMCINIVVHKGKSPIERILKEQLKNGLKCLSGLVKILVNLLLSILKAITNSKNPNEILKTIFETAKSDTLTVLKNGLKNNLNSLLNGSLAELKKIIQGKFDDDKGIISSWTDYFLKGAKLCSSITQAEDLTNFLIQNDIISLDGELNGEEIFGKREEVLNNKIKLKVFINNNNPLRNITSKIVDVPLKKIEKILNDIKREIQFHFEQEIQSLISRVNELFYSGINFIMEKKEEMKNSIKDTMFNYKDEMIQSLINNLNHIKQSIIDFSNFKNELMDKEFKKVKKSINNIENMINNKLKESTSKLINNIYNLIKSINKIIDFDKVIKIFETISNKLIQISKKIIDNYIPIIQMINVFLDNKMINQIVEKVQQIINIILPIINKQIIPIIEFNKKQKNVFNEIDLNPKKLNIRFNSNQIINQMDIISKNSITINENNVNIIKSQIDELIMHIYDIDEKINIKGNEILDILFKPCDEIKIKLEKIYNDTEDKVNNITSTVKKEFNYNFEKIIKSAKDLIGKTLESAKDNKIIEKGLNEALKQGDKIYKNVNGLLKKAGLDNPMALLRKFQSLYEGMDQYEKSSQIDETINILNDVIIDALINILFEALQNSEIGKFLKEGSDALLKGMESMKNNLKNELKEIGALEGRENTSSINKKNALMKIINKNNFDILKFNFGYEKIQSGFKKLMNLFLNMISKNMIRELKFPKEAQTIMYINSKIGKNPLKKMIIKQSEIVLKTINDILPLLRNFIKKIIFILKLNDDPYDSFQSLFGEFSSDSLYNKLKDCLSESLINIKTGILSLIKDLICGNFKNKKNEIILTWTDYFIKGIKICSKVN